MPAPVFLHLSRKLLQVGVLLADQHSVLLPQFSRFMCHEVCEQKRLSWFVEAGSKFKLRSGITVLYHMMHHHALPPYHITMLYSMMYHWDGTSNGIGANF